MPTAILRTEHTNRAGNAKVAERTVTITHNNRRLFHQAGRTYEYVGNDRFGNRIYRDTAKR